MKKRIAVAVVFVLLLTITVGALTGCDEIFKKNAERDANLVVATVNYAGQTAYVYKAELSNSFNNYAYLYVNYYGMTYEQAADYIVQSLAQRELLVLFAREYLVEALALNKEPALATWEELLTTSERNKAVKDTNEDMLSALNSALEALVTEDKYSDTDDKEEESSYVEYTGSDSVRVYFDSMGGSDVDRQRIKSGTTAFEPKAPTRDGYTFYGWYTDKDYTQKFDFTTVLDGSNTVKPGYITLYARWEKYTAPRPVKAEETADADADYDPDNNEASALTEPRFFDGDKLSAEYKKLIVDREVKLEYLANYTDADYAAALEKHLDKAVEQVVKNLKSGFRDYDFYIENEMKTLLVTKLERYVGKAASVEQAEVAARFEQVVKMNSEAFADSVTSYESALKSSLATTYLHKFGAVDKRYGFVSNILLKLPEDQLAELTALVTDGNYGADVITAERDRLLAAMTVKVSNPAYDADYKCDKHTCEDGSSCDPMTCDNHACKDTATVVEGSAGYGQIIEFKYENGEGKIVYNVEACPSMAYLPEEVSAVSIAEQIYNSLEQVASYVVDDAVPAEGKMTHVQGIYWIRKVTEAWLYLVGDDSGSTSSDSNNGGLGYLVTPEGESSGYIDSFTDHARALIANGAGSYSTDGTFGLGKSYVYGDSFIDTGSTSGAYAGIFVLVCTAVPCDVNAWTVIEKEDGTYEQKQFSADDFKFTASDGSVFDCVLPYDYIVTYDKDLDKCVTVGSALEEGVLTGKKSVLYENKVNAFGQKEYQNIQYNKKAYKSIWKDMK